MNTPFSWKLTACACAVLLAACGSSSSASEPLVATNTATSTTSTTTGSSTTDTTTTGSTTNSGSTTDTAAATEEKIIKYGDNAFDKSMTFDNQFNWGGVATQQPHLRDTKHVASTSPDGTETGQLDKVWVDGREIMLFKATHTPRMNVMTGGKVEEDENGKAVYTNAVFQSTRGGYSYTWFGIINKSREDIDREDNITEHIDTMIAHGKLTPKEEVPTVGTAKYTGHAIYYTNGVPSFPARDPETRYVLPIDPNKKLGTTQFDVDYGKKTISGSVKHDAGTAADIALQAKIDGNSFEGSKAQKFNGKDVNVEMKGRFFGPNAAEMGGVFNSRENDDILGAFGAKKAK